MPPIVSQNSEYLRQYLKAKTIRQRLFDGEKKPARADLYLKSQDFGKVAHVASATPALLAPPAENTVARIKYDVSKKYDIAIPFLEGVRRNAYFVQARNECYYRAYVEIGKSLPQIARLMGGRDHTTILRGFRRYGDWMHRKCQGYLTQKTRCEIIEWRLIIDGLPKTKNGGAYAAFE